jgi:phosphoenolpyruvate carboxykinase (GTP)
MDQKAENLLKEKLSPEHYEKLAVLGNPKLDRFVADVIELGGPDRVYVCTDSDEDIAYVRRMAIEAGEEIELGMEGHTIHYDGYKDQARDPANTKYLVGPDENMGADINTADKHSGLAEVREIFKNGMAGKEMLVRFFCLGPTNSEFSIPCVQITDSYYVGHSEDMLYRPGYEQFRRIGDSEDFFRFMHTAGRLDGAVSADVDKRRVYMDLAESIVYSTNTQYAGNTVGLKKLALRLAIKKASQEDWLAEHMFVMGAQGPGGRVTYLAGAFPSACGKTSTAMLPGQTIIGDDIAYLRRRDGKVYGANVESGIFGIIRDVNSEDDPVIWDALTTPGEAIFSNVLVTDGTPYWLGDNRDRPASGINHSGEWTPGKKDANGNEIDHSHKNARYTLQISALSNKDPELHNPDGVPIGGIIYGGRDSDTCVPLEEAFDWAHGIITKGASIESETTAATLGAEGVRKFNPMANLDFVAIPIGSYIQKNLDFADGLSDPPKVFAVNYFLKSKDGRYLNGILDKLVWVQWIEKRVNGEADVIETPTGRIPLYEDLQPLFAKSLDKEFTEADYVEQFTIRIPEQLAKLERIEEIYRTRVPDTPQIVFDVIAAQRARLNETREKFGDYVSPLTLRADG